mmetsp:Transcript_66028/g.123140  ORF Transcript_66028/g.123140 Transcript_66028/m.123140 type:complete len:425 (-) Transcript_66028:63-1337(-)
MAAPATLDSSQICYREYVDADDAQCKDLEGRAMQGNRYPALDVFLKTFFRAGFEHQVTFDAKAKQYGEYAVHVAEVKETGVILGVCCCILKKVWLYGEQHKVGYVFDLRVDEAYQGCGIGKNLTQRMEEVCIQRGASHFYLSVNEDNTKAKCLYGRRGYGVCSERKPVQYLLMAPVEEVTDVKVELVSVEEGLRLTEDAFGKTDMTPADLKQLFQSPLYEGTLVARSGSSIAGMSLWNGSYFVGFRVTRFFLPVWCWQMRSVRWAFCFGLAYLGWRWTCSVHGSFLRARQHGGIYDPLMFTLKAGLSLGVSVGISKVWKVVSFATKKITTAGTKLRGRGFAPFASGPQEEKDRLLQAVICRAKNICYENGYAMMLINMDGKDEMRKAFGPSPFTTLFMIKKVGVSTGDAATPLAPANFFDPRDI